MGRRGLHFMELNARLQVEHPVTEAVTGARPRGGPAAGGGRRAAVVASAGRPAAAATPSRLASTPRTRGPASPRRADASRSLRGPRRRATCASIAGVGRGDVIGTRYDPLLAKVIASGPTRSAALDRLDHALAATATIGVTTNRDFLRAVLAWPEVRHGRVVTDTLDARWPAVSEALPDEAWGLAAAALAAPPEGQAVGAAHRLPPQRTAPSRRGHRRGGARGGGRSGAATDRAPVPCGGPMARSCWMSAGGPWSPGWPHPRRSTPPCAMRLPRPAATSSARRSPGVIGTVRVAPGEAVAAGQVLLTLEAMKMEHPVRATADGLVTRLLVRAGQAVQRGDELVGLT